MAAARAKKDKPAPGPDDLVRESAGAYTTGDGRFRVEKSGVGWYLLDNDQANEFGQQLIHGPLPTLDAVREQIPGAREIKPLLRVRPSKTKPPTSRGAARQERPAPAPPPPPASWIDRLPGKEATDVRRLIRALEHDARSSTSNLRWTVSARRLSSVVSRRSLTRTVQRSNGRHRAGHSSRSVTGTSCRARGSDCLTKISKPA